MSTNINKLILNQKDKSEQNSQKMQEEFFLAEFEKEKSFVQLIPRMLPSYLKLAINNGDNTPILFTNSPNLYALLKDLFNYSSVNIQGSVGNFQANYIDSEEISTGDGDSYCSHTTKTKEVKYKFEFCGESSKDSIPAISNISVRMGLTQDLINEFSKNCQKVFSSSPSSTDYPIKVGYRIFENFAADALKEENLRLQEKIKKEEKEQKEIIRKAELKALDEAKKEKNKQDDKKIKIGLIIIISLIVLGFITWMNSWNGFRMFQ